MKPINEKSAEAKNNLEKRRDSRHKEIGGLAHWPMSTKEKPLRLHLCLYFISLYLLLYICCVYFVT
jgi:hypothetical protein